MKIKDLMIPVTDYAAVDEDATLLDVFLALEGASHRDMLVRGADGAVRGKLTMVDVFRALEPNYRRLEDQEDAGRAILTREYVGKVFKRYDLWTDTIPTLCSRVASLRVSEVMRESEEGEFVSPDDDLETAIHRYIMGVRQPLLVRREGSIVGVLRFSDVYDAVGTHILACER